MVSKIILGYRQQKNASFFFFAKLLQEKGKSCLVQQVRLSHGRLREVVAKSSDGLLSTFFNPFFQPATTLSQSGFNFLW